MKGNLTNNQEQFLTALILTGILSVSSGLTPIKDASAASTNLSLETTNQVLKENAKPDSIKPVPIPANELPPPLDEGVVLREIASGGITGRTYETVLRKDGILIRVRIGDANDSERSVRRVSLQQVQKFEQLLDKKRFSKYQNLSYPAPNGSADFISYTLTSQVGTFQYNDISQDSLPKTLQSVVEAWNQLRTNAQ
ncbi:hypothetical protein [Cylindrospermum sp. FACHB-282]|uniref:hypothetical protein n=1 Tax=Cylindrospermum sp. FACHB-282 TaxID=2692794 RepID=UPI001688992E|nr:hypothetical protein [Cylindrospermum sp. FACHB-282]MBD2387642.1 hypothetical protein [Cylindrospermum sp. FACHB-282]